MRTTFSRMAHQARTFGRTFTSLSSSGPGRPPSRTVETRVRSGADDDPTNAPTSRLGQIIKRKKDTVERQLLEMGDEDLEDRLTTATMQGPGDDGFRFSQKVLSTGMRRGGPLAIFEVHRLDPTEPSEHLAERARRLVEAGADAIAVRMDEESTPEGEKDLFMVSRAVAADVPIFARDWFLHPLQIVDAKAAGATGIIGIVASVTQRGSPVLSSFGAALGLDCPVEIVNLSELKQMEGLGVPFFAMDIGVGISVGIAGFSRQLISGVLSEMDFNALSIVGVSSIDELSEKIDTKADALYIKSGLIYGGKEAELVRAILDACHND